MNTKDLARMLHIKGFGNYGDFWRSPSNPTGVIYVSSDRSKAEVAALLPAVVNKLGDVIQPPALSVPQDSSSRVTLLESLGQYVLRGGSKQNERRFPDGRIHLEIFDLGTPGITVFYDCDGLGEMLGDDES